MSALLSLASLSGTGCIVAEPPDYGPAQRSPIFMYNPHPNPWSVQVLSRLSTGNPPVSTIVPFGATVRSEDAGEQLVALRYLDYQHGAQFPISKLLAPATLEDERQIVFDIIPSRDFPLGGCHSITIMAMHLSSYNQDAGKFDGPPEDLAQESWIVSVDNVDGTFRVADCPLSTAEQ
ncbi:MAG TPA: hypothetical protein VFV94_16085 [Polyangiaceae bacterium]|nr:hypothetical protein [Polyangiaceae bacterium]